MIEYINPNRAFTGEAYDETYRYDPDRFGHGITFRALDALFDRWLKLDRPLRAFDLGCGQGQVIRHVRQCVCDRAPEQLTNSVFYGIDISEVAIRQCEAREPAVRWIADSFQDFLDRPETAAQRGAFDLIINKGGLTQVRSAEEYRAMLAGIRSLLREGGIYLFIQYKQFYQVWSNEHCADWDTDIFEVAEDLFGPAERMDDDSAYICVFRKGAVRKPAIVAKPRRIAFRMNDGSEQRVFVSGDELTSERLRRLRATPDRNQFRAFDMMDGATDRERQRHVERTERARDDFRAGLPTALIGIGRVRMTDAKAIDPFPIMYQSMCERFNVVNWPGMLATTRHLCKAAPAWSLARPDAVVIGPGLEDFKRSFAPVLPIVDPDEFRYRLDWVIGLLTGETRATVVYVATPPMVDFDDDRNSYQYRRADGQAYAQVAAEVCAEHHARFDDVSKYMSAGDLRERQAAVIAERASAALGTQERVPCAR